MTGTSYSPTGALGVSALVFFFVFGCTMSGLAAVMLIYPGSVLDALWRLNPRAQNSLHAMGVWAVALMLSVCFACAAAATGLKRRRLWGFWIAIAILGINLVGDLVNAVFARDWRALIGLPIGTIMLAYLLANRRIFHSSEA
jgi:hypothetical protein